MQSPIIPADIYVTVFFVANRNKEGFMLEKGLEFSDITDAIFQDDQMQMYIDGKYMLTVGNSLGWEHILCDGVTQMGLHKITVNQIHDQDVIVVRVRDDRINGRILLSVLLSENEKIPVLKSRIKYLCNSYCGYRTVAHDGNDYFRSVYFALFESFIVSNRRHMFLSLMSRFKNLLSELVSDSPNGPTDRTIYNHDMTMSYLHYVLKVLQEAADGLRWMTVQELEADLLDAEYELDNMIVLILRRLTTQFILENKQMKLANNGTTSLESIILSSYPHYKDLRVYCDECINKSNVSVVGPVVDYGCLFYSMNLQGTIALVDRNKEVKLSLTTVGVTNAGDDDDAEACFGKVHLLFRQGSYDILYLENDLFCASGKNPYDMSVKPLTSYEYTNMTIATDSNASQGHATSLNHGNGHGATGNGTHPGQGLSIAIHHSHDSTSDGVRSGGGSPAKPPQPPQASSANNSRPTSLNKQQSGTLVFNSNLINMGGIGSHPSSVSSTRQNSFTKLTGVNLSNMPLAENPMSMETMKARLDGLGVAVDDMNIIHELCQHCPTVEQGVTYYYQHIVPRLNNISPFVPSAAPYDHDESHYAAIQVPLQHSRGMSTNNSKNVSRANSFGMEDMHNMNLHNGSSHASNASNMSSNAGSFYSDKDKSVMYDPSNPLAGNDQYIHRQFLQLLRVGYDIDQILEAIDVGQCTTYDIALGYLRRKLKYSSTKEHSKDHNNTFSDLRMESEVDSNGNHSHHHSVGHAGPIVVGGHKPLTVLNVHGSGKLTPTLESNDSHSGGEEHVRKPVNSGIAKLQGLMSRGVLTAGRSGSAKSSSSSASNIKSMMSNLKSQQAMEQTQAQPGAYMHDDGQEYGDESGESDDRGQHHMNDVLSRNTVTITTAIPRVNSQVPRTMQPQIVNAPMSMNASMPVPVTAHGLNTNGAMNMSMYNGARSMNGNGVQMHPGARPMMQQQQHHPQQQMMQQQMPQQQMMQQQMPMQGMQQQQMPGYGAPRPRSRPPSQQYMAPQQQQQYGPRGGMMAAPSLSISSLSDEQRVIYNKLLGMQHSQAEALRVAAKYSTIDEFCDWMESQQKSAAHPPPAPIIQDSAADAPKKKSGWGALKMFTSK